MYVHVHVHVSVYMIRHIKQGKATQQQVTGTCIHNVHIIICSTLRGRFKVTARSINAVFMIYFPCGGKL